jgi:hypothetical protein
LALHFDKAEYRARIDMVTRELAREGLDGLLMFNHSFTIRTAPSSHAQSHGFAHLSTWTSPWVRLNTAQVGC